MWIMKIQEIWDKLEQNKNHIEASSIEDKIKNNRRTIRTLDQENFRQQFRIYDL